MSPSRTVLSLSSLLALAACGGGDDDGGGGGAADAAPAAIDGAPAIDADLGPDAAPAVLGCAGAALPTTAADPVEVSGQTVTLQLASLGPVGGVSLSAFAVGGDAPIAGPATSDGGGLFALSAATGGEPLDAYLVAKLDGHLETYLFPPTAVTEDLAGGLVPVLTANHVDTMAGFAQQTLERGTGHMVVAVIDCAGDPIEGAQVRSDPAGDVVYLDPDGFPANGRTSTSSQGVAVIFNVAPGAVTVEANRGAVELRSNDVEVHDGAITATLLVP